MKLNKTLLAVCAVVGMGTLGTASAQIALPENKGVTIGIPDAVSDGNKIEQDVAPLMRSIAKKKSEVDLKALDRELEKMQDDSLKDQIARERMLLELQQLSSGQMPMNNQQQRGSGVGFQGGMPSNAPVGVPEVELVPEDPLRVLLVYGFQENLKAKVSMNGVGGYVVQKGDILPDGRKVLRVTNAFVEVSDNGVKEKLHIKGTKSQDKNSSVAASNFAAPVPQAKPIVIPIAPPAM